MPPKARKMVLECEDGREINVKWCVAVALLGCGSRLPSLRCLSLVLSARVVLSGGAHRPGLRRYDPTTRAELEASICASAGLPEGTRFQLVDDDGDAIVLSNSIPNMTRLTLKVMDQPDKAAAAGGGGQKKRRHSGGAEGRASGGGGGAKKLRSHTQAGKERPDQPAPARSSAAPPPAER
jgi:hypothetical protein